MTSTGDVDETGTQTSVSSRTYLIAGQRAINQCLAKYSAMQQQKYDETAKKGQIAIMKLNEVAAPRVSCFDKKFKLNETVQTFLTNMQVACNQKKEPPIRMATDRSDSYIDPWES